MRLGIVGSRRRNSPKDKAIIKKKLIKYKPDMIVSGGCSRGADRFAEELAKEFGIPILICWAKLPPKGSSSFLFKKAYLNRNTTIAEQSDKMIALAAPDRKGGTEDTIIKFLKHKVVTGRCTEDVLEIL